MTDARTTALRSLADFAAQLKPRRITGPGYEPTNYDADMLCDELTELARAVDRVVEAYGDYCQSHGIVSRKDLTDYFNGALFGALDGNALYLIKRGVEDRQEELREQAAEARYERQRELRREEA